MSFKNKKKQKLKKFGTLEKLEKLREAEFLLENELFGEALPFLEEAVEKYPSDARFWEFLAAVSNELKNVPVMQKSFAKLKQLQPNNANAWFGLAYANALDSRIALAHRGFDEFCKKFPDDENIAEAAELGEMAGKDLQLNLAEFDFPAGDEGVDLACLHEESQILMQQHKFDEARAKAEKVISRMPDFVPAYNNLSLVLFMDGEAEAAAEMARKVLAKQPENFHALANLVRFSVFLGKPDEAQNFANRLRSVESDKPEVWIKKIEAFTFAGDDQAVVEVFKEANKKSKFAVPENFGKHLAAVAFYRLGKQNQARKIWMEILNDDPNVELAGRNMEEMHLPENERNVFALPMNYWIPARYIKEFFQSASNIKDGRNFEKNLQKKVARFFEENPNILNVLSILLERGDESTKEFALKLMDWAGTPESYAALKDFAFSQNGSDQMRYKAAMTLSEADVISNKVRLWNDGEWRELSLMTFEITGEPTDIYPMKSKAHEMLAKGLEAMNKQNLDLAAQYFQKALEANGEDHPSLLYNLLTIEQAKGNRAEAETKLRELVRRLPEYSFAAISLATMEVKNDNIEAAKTLVERFYEKKKWHFSEIKIWFYFNLEMALKEKHFDSARTSLEMLREFDENLDYKYWDDLISQMELLETIKSIPRKLSRRKKKK